jgi:hypothetical protein
MSSSVLVIFWILLATAHQYFWTSCQPEASLRIRKICPRLAVKIHTCILSVRGLNASAHPGTCHKSGRSAWCSSHSTQQHLAATYLGHPQNWPLKVSPLQFEDQFMYLLAVEEINRKVSHNSRDELTVSRTGSCWLYSEHSWRQAELGLDSLTT